MSERIRRLGMGDLPPALAKALRTAVLLAIGRYVTHSLVVNALALRPPVASIFVAP